MFSVYTVAGATLLPDILSGLSAFTNTSQPLKYRHLVISYKPFISLFEMLGLMENNANLRAYGEL